MATFGIEFAVTCETSFGEKACICGNLPALGQWNPTQGVILVTEKNSYPVWTTPASLRIRDDQQVEFKLCVMKGDKVVRWELLTGNRSFTPRGSLIIEFTESDPAMIFKTPRRHSGQLQVQNVRKGTSEVMESWGSDSSSNREMWRQHEADDEEEGSLLLTQFTNQLTRSVASQREEGFPTLQLEPEMQIHQLDFGAYANHRYHSHYVLASPHQHPLVALPSKYSSDQIVTLGRERLEEMQLGHREEISLFHVLDWDEKSDDCEYVKTIVRHWKRAAVSGMRGLIILYLLSDPSPAQLQALLQSGVSAFVLGNIQSTSRMLTSFSSLHYNLYCSKPDVFTLRKNRGRQVKLIFFSFSPRDFLLNIEEELEDFKEKLLEHYYFSFQAKQFELKLGEKLSVWRMSKCQCLIILQVWKLDELQSKTISDLVHLSSQRFKVIVFVILHEKFPRNIQHRIPVDKHKVIFMNTHGDIYASTGQIIDLFYYLEINKTSFENNQNIILEQIGSGLSKYYWKNSSLVLQFPENTLGEVLKQRALRLTRDVNKKSIAKLIVQSSGISLQFMPFCLHISFIYKVILTTFALRLKHNQKGMVISIDGTDLSSLRYLEVPQGPERSLKFLKFCLRTREVRVSYACNPMSETQVQRMLEMISQQCQEEGTPRKGEALAEVKHVR